MNFFDILHLPPNIWPVTWRGNTTFAFARELVFKLNPGLAATFRGSAEMLVAALDAAGLAAGAQLVDLANGLFRLRIPNIRPVNLSSALQLLNELPYVQYAEPSFVHTTFENPDDRRFPEQWMHKSIGSTLAWDVSKGSDSILMAFIDTGIGLRDDGQLAHPDLVTTRYFLGENLVEGGRPDDRTSHGTKMIGIASATGNNNTGVAGMNWTSPVYVCRTFDDAQQSTPALFTAAVKAIVQHARSQGKKVVINYSGGGYDDSDALREGCSAADAPDVLLCCAAGKDSTRIAYPAKYSTDFNRLIAVGATDDQDAVLASSGRGPQLNLVAPGFNILTTTPSRILPGVVKDYDSCSGTSPAAALVTGLASLVWSKQPERTSNDVKKILVQTARKLGPGNFDNNWGFGRIDATKALQA